MVTRSKGREIVKVKVNKAMSGILSFIWILYLKQRNNVLWCFYSSKYEEILLVITFSFVPYFTVRGWSIQLERSKQNVLLKTSSLKYHSWMWELPLEVVAICLWSLKEDLLRELQILKICYTATDHHGRLNTSFKHYQTEPM